MTKSDIVLAYLDLGSWAYLFGPSFAVAGVALVALVYLNRRAKPASSGKVKYNV